jgi:seryl-tRNA synthetase
MNLVVSRFPMRRLQDLQVGLLQEIQNRGEKAHQELTRIMDERVQLQQQYDVVLQQKKEVEGWVKEVLKDKTEVEERVKKSLKEKDEVEAIAQKTQATVQKLYKAIPEVPIVVKATMEEQVLNIGEVIKGFREHIQDLQLRSMPGTPPEVHKGRERMVTKTVSNIKRIEGECTKLCEESAQCGQN